MTSHRMLSALSRIEMAAADFAFGNHQMAAAGHALADATASFAVEATLVLASDPMDDDGYYLEERLAAASAMDEAAVELILISKTP